MKNRLVCILIILYLIIMTFVSENELPYFILLLMALVFILQIIGNLYLKHRLEFDFTKDGIKVKNHSRLPVLWLFIELKIKNNTTAVTRTKCCEGVVNSRTEIIFPWKGFDWADEKRTAGFYELEISRAVLKDIFGIFGIQIKEQKAGNLIKMPAFYAIDPKFFDAKDKSELEGNRNSEQSPYGEVVSIREYQPGDSLKQIHFKLSAKMDKLYAKEFEAEEMQAPLLIYETIDLPDSAIEENELERRLEEFFSICISLIQSEIFFYIVWYDAKQKRLEKHEIPSMDSLMETTKLFMRCERSKSNATTKQIMEYEI